MFYRVEFSKIPNSQITKYIGNIGTEHCPFIFPSSKVNLLLFSHHKYNKPASSIALIEHFFYVLLLHTEIFRKHRKSLEENKILLCDNIIIEYDKKIIENKILFNWIHWFLKIIYTEKGVGFGKFWKGEKILSKEGKSIIPPPINLFSIRSLLKPQDLKFFIKTEYLKNYFLSSDDDGSGIFDKIISNNEDAVFFDENISSVKNKKEFDDLIVELKLKNIFDECLKLIIIQEDKLKLSYTKDFLKRWKM